MSVSVNAAKKKKKVLLVYENMGAGHVRMAKILQDMLTEDDVELVLADGEGITGSATPDFAVNAWNWLLKKNWRCFQDLFMNYLFRMVVLPLIEVSGNTTALEKITLIKPDLIICVCDCYSRVLGEYARENTIPFYLIITDIAVCYDLVNTQAVHVCYFPETAAAVQSYPLAAGYYAQHLSRYSRWQEKLSYVLRFYYDFICQRRKNLFYRNRESEIAVCNSLPCRIIGPLAEKKFFACPDKQQLRKTYRLLPDIATVVIASGGQGGQYLRKVVQVLAGSYQQPLNVLVMCGHDNVTLRKLQTDCGHDSQMNIIPVGYTDCFHEYLGMADCAIIRPSAGTFMECLLQHIPVIVPAATLANDRGSLMIIRRYQLGEVYERLPSIPAVLTKVLANKQQYVDNLERFMKQYPACYEQQKTNLRCLLLGKEETV